MAETRIQKTSFSLANQFYQTQVAKEDNFTYFSTWFLNVDKRIPLIWVFPWLIFTFFSFPSRWQEQTFHSWTSILLKWYARKQKIWAAELEFTNNNRCFLCWELLSVRKTDRKLLSLYSSLLRKRIAHNKKYAYTQVEYLVDKSCKLNPTPISFKTQLCNQN